MNDELVTRAKVRELDREAARLQRLNQALAVPARTNHEDNEPPSSITPSTTLSLLKEIR